MRVDLASLDPGSALARRICEALARDGKAEKKRLTTRQGRRAEGKSRVVDVWHNEEALQRAAFGMIEQAVQSRVLAFHVPNGGKRGKAEAGRLKAMGTLAGIPDLVFVIDGKAHGIELKTATGRHSKAQRTMAERWRRAGGQYEIARSLQEVRAILMRWGALRGP